jgi:uncharacterized protein YbjT (DUF2867 family)
MVRPTVAITGTTGRVCSRVAKEFASLGAPLRLLARDASKAPKLEGCEVASASYNDFDASKKALEGIKVLLRISAHETKERVGDHLNFIEAAKEAGVQHVVYTSFFGASPACAFLLARDHWDMEQAIRAKIPKWTFLRNNTYSDVLLGGLSKTDSGSVIRFP